MATQARGLKRVGSAHNLAPPGSDGSQGAGHLSRSLPPSPQHSPAPSRKVGLLFWFCASFVIVFF